MFTREDIFLLCGQHGLSKEMRLINGEMWWLYVKRYCFYVVSISGSMEKLCGQLERCGGGDT